MEIGERLKQIRNSKKLSIYKVSQESGISQNHIKDLENGRRNPSLETIKRLAVSLGITLPELLNENSEVSILSEKEKLLVEYYRRLPDQKAELLLQLGKTLLES